MQRIEGRDAAGVGRSDARGARDGSADGLWSAALRRHRWACARVGAAHPDLVVSHASAAVVHGLPVLVRTGAVEAVAARGRARPVLRRVRGVVLRPGGASRRGAGAAWALTVDGVRVTGAARTVVDVARTRPSPAALALADAALRTGLVTADTLDDELDRAGGGPGVAAARRVLARADGRSASAGESVSRARLLEAGTAVPLLHPSAADGPDAPFWWPRHGVAGRLVVAGDAAPAAPWTDEGGIRVVSWTWADALAGTPLVARLRAAGVR